MEHDTEDNIRFDAASHESYDPADLAAVRADAQMAVAFRSDGDSLLFARQLDFVKARTYARKYPELSGGIMVPDSSEAPEYAMTITTRTYDEVGMAKVISNYADDNPRADVRAIERTVKVQTFGSSYGYNINEIQASRALGLGLDTRKAAAARRAVEQKLNRVKFKGEPEYGLQGLFTNPNVAVVAMAAAGTWASKTGTQILADLNALYTAIITQSNGVHMPNMLALPPTQYAAASTKALEGMPGQTPMSFFRQQHPELQVRVVFETRNAGTANADVAFMYELNDENLRHELVMPFNQLPPEPRNLEFVVNCMARSAGVQIDYPLAFAKMEGI